MIKLIAVPTKKPGITLEQFSDRWLNGHAPYLRRVPGLRRYVQSHRVVDGPEGGNAPYPGFASLWFDDEEAARAAPKSPEMTAAISHSEDFSVPGATKVFVAREHVMRDTPATPGMVKLVFFMYRKPGMTPEAFRKHWLEVHGQLALKHLGALRRYVQNHAVDSEYQSGEPAFDGLVEAWMDSMEALKAAEASGEHQFVRSDELNFLDVPRITFMAVREHVIF